MSSENPEKNQSQTPFLAEVVSSTESPVNPAPEITACADAHAPIVGFHVQWKEIVAVLPGIVLCDITIYHGMGYSGLAVFVAALAVLLFCGSSNPIHSKPTFFLLAAAVLVSLKLFWSGFIATAAVGIVVLILLGGILAGTRFSLAPLLEYAYLALFSGKSGLLQYVKKMQKLRFWPRQGMVLAVVIPFVVLVVFGVIFVSANPDLAKSFHMYWQMFYELVKNLLPDSVFEVFFWVVSTWLLVGLFRPIEGFFRRSDCSSTMSAKFFDEAVESSRTASESEMTVNDFARYYPAFRNTLIGVIILFTVYLAFEFATLWFRTFEPGFYYAGYAHEGAAWLVVALAVSSLVLSIIFHGPAYRHSRIEFLKKLAWIWSIQNVMLAVAVYNRLFIYIDFNGMTRMRIVGLLGMTAVLIGFIGVMIKIARKRDVYWLLHQFAGCVLGMVFLGLILPVDLLVHQYNVRRVLAGDLAPSVQTSTNLQPNSIEGMLTLFPLIQCDDPIIAEGIKATIADQFIELEKRSSFANPSGYRWTEFQYSHFLFRKKCAEHESELQGYMLDSNKRLTVKQQFQAYVYQWY